MVLGKRKGRSAVQEEKISLIESLGKASSAKDWLAWVPTLQSASVETLQKLSDLVQYAVSHGFDPGDLRLPGTYGTIRELQKVPNERKLNPQIFDEALQQLKIIREKSQNEPNTDDDDASSRAVIEAELEMDVEVPATSDDDTRNSRSISPDASPHGEPFKEQRPHEHFDLTSDSTPYEEQKEGPLLAERANKVISQMGKNVMLTDDVLMASAEFLKFSYPESNSQLLDSFCFRVHEENVPCQLKDQPQCGEKVYAFLHHPNGDPHWTLCVFMFEDKSIHLDFYDSITNNDRASRVKSFFAKWINKQYHGSKLQFANKQEAPQQNDKTSCGIFALEIMRRLLSSEEVKQPIGPMEVRRALLQRMTSIDTTSPHPDLKESTLETLRSIQKYSPIRAIIDKISAAAGPQRASFATLLHHAEEEIAQTTEEINGLEPKHKVAKNELSVLRTEFEVTKTSYADLLADETADIPIPFHSEMRGDEQSADGSREPSARKHRKSKRAMVQGISNMLSQYADSMVQENMDKMLDVRRKRVEEAEKNEKEIAEQLHRLRSHADSADAIASIYRACSHFENIGVDAPIIASNIIQRQARSDSCG
ncbi:hypothetical protein FPRO04_13721 [Fusarium proliferatum]|nr:hypothetical protein FPRO04_13721 [Fusarium proliferatum]